MALKDLVTDLGSFYENNPFAADFKSKAGPTYAQKYGFNQRSLQFGKDRPGDGSSRQPFIKSILPNVTSDPTSATGLLAGITREITSRIDDLERIGRYLITPKGLQFIAKQQLLSAQNPIVPGRPNRASPLKGFYNPLNTLAQVAASGTGLHLEKQGTPPIGFQDEQVKYEQVYKESSKENLFEGSNLIKLGGNRLALLQNLTATKHSIGKSDATSGVAYNVGSNIISYNGGPGILTTNIRYADNNVYQGLAITNSGISTYTLKQLNEQESARSPVIPDNIGLITKDFRSKILPIPGNQEQKQVGPFGETNTRDYTSSTINKIKRVGIGDPGKKSRDRSNVYNIDFDTVDKVAALPLYTDTNVAALKSHSRDFIRFRFEVLSNKNSEATYVHFRAFLGAITDNYGGQWDSTKYVGRGDTFYNYTGFTRTISLSFKVHPQSRSEMKAMYQKLTYLASTLAPDYTDGYMKGNITRLTIGSYFYRIPGFITSLTYSVPEDASWEIAFDQPEGGQEQDQMETPRHFDISVSFTPIHNFAPQLMDGTRAYALFTPDQKNSGQLNPYIPAAGVGTAISSNATKANEAVESIK